MCQDQRRWVRLACLVSLGALAGCILLRAQESLTKKPIPDAGSLEQALALVEEVYGGEFKRAKDVAQKTALAEKLLQKAKESAADPTGQFALLRVAKDIAALAGDADLALFAVDDMAATFQIETFPTKVEALLKAAQAASQPKQHARIVRRAEPLIELAVQQDDFITAGDLSQAALSAARKSADSDLVKKTVARGKETDEIASAYAAVRDAIAKLKTDPVDAEANLAVGKYRCLVKGDWERGISYLALGNDPALKELAIRELKGVSDADGQVELGDGWWDLGAASEGTAQSQLQRRAVHWYRKVLPGLTGLAKDKIEKRIQQISGVLIGSHAATGSGEAVVPNTLPRIDRIVLWNQHNGGWNNSGTQSCNVVLLSDNAEVWRRNDIEVPWARNRDTFATLPIPRISADRVRIEINRWIDTSGGLAEVEVFSGRLNIAKGCKAIASAEHRPNDPRAASCLTDGITSSQSRGFWLLPERRAGWAEIDLQNGH